MDNSTLVGKGDNVKKEDNIQGMKRILARFVTEKSTSAQGFRFIEQRAR